MLMPTFWGILWPFEQGLIATRMSAGPDSRADMHPNWEQEHGLLTCNHSECRQKPHSPYLLEHCNFDKCKCNTVDTLSAMESGFPAKRMSNVLVIGCYKHLAIFKEWAVTPLHKANRQNGIIVIFIYLIFILLLITKGLQGGISFFLHDLHLYNCSFLL